MGSEVSVRAVRLGPGPHHDLGEERDFGHD
jgi:hypothetical protein